jgi:hypothetical protein
MEKTARAELGEIIEFGPRTDAAYGKLINILGHQDLRKANDLQSRIDLYSDQFFYDRQDIKKLRSSAFKKRAAAIAIPALAATGAAGYMIGKSKEKNLSAREELDLILFRSPTIGELEKQEKKSSTAKNLAIAGGVSAGVGGLGYLAYKGGKAFGTAKEEAQKGSRAVRTILEDKLSPAIEEMKKVAIRGQEATEIPSFMGRRMGTVIENAKLAYQPGEAARASREAFREGLQKGVPAADKAKLPYAIARKLGRVAGRIGKWRATLGPFSARDELNLILFADPRPRNSLGMFSGGGMEGMPSSQAMKITYDPRRLQAGMPKEGGLMQIGRPIRRIMRR